MGSTRIVDRKTTALWIALVILAGVAALTYRSIDATAGTLAWVEHTTEVLRQIEEVSGAYARATSARRAYVVAGDASQLADAPELDERVAGTIAILRSSLADNPEQGARLEAWALLLDQRLKGLDASVALRRRDGTGIETAEGLALGTRIRAAREEMEHQENRLLADRDARTRRDVATTKFAEIVGTLASFAILLLAFRRLRHEIGRRRQSESFLDSIVENLPNMIFVKEAGALRFERINRAGEELLGIDRTELVGKNDFDFFPRQQAESFHARDRETLHGRVVVDISEEPLQTKAGERWLHTKKVPVFDDDGVPKYLLGISDDITEQRKVAAALRSAKNAAESANKELEAFSYSVAHDLRAPLRAIDGFTQAIEEDCADMLDEEGKGYLQRVRFATRHMSQLIDGLLGLSRLTRGEIVRARVDLARIARQSAARLREAHPQRQVELVVHDGLDTEGDAGLLAAALDNLLSNSWKFTSKCAHPRVEVGRRTEEGRPVFFVRDNGAGFEQAYVHKLFGAFQRLHTASEFEGFGIGLATVQRIVHRHGGRVWAEGEVGRGATFYFTL